MTMRLAPVTGLPLIPFGGVWADKYSRKAIIIRSALVEVGYLSNWREEEDLRDGSIELERGRLAGVMPIRTPHPVTEYLKLQTRFRHLFANSERAHEELEHLQALADHNIETYRLSGNHADARDSEGADTVRRGGMRWA